MLSGRLQMGNKCRQSSSTTEEIRRVTWVGLLVNVGLAIFKLIAGYFGRSQAVVADGVHSLSDMSSDIAILIGIRFWTKPADDNHPYGHQRIETMVALAIGLFLAVVAVGLVWNSITTIKDQNSQAPSWVALAAALVSVASKEILYQWTIRKGSRLRSAPLIANAWHHRSDALSSIPVVLAVGAALLDPRWRILDNIATVAVALFIMQAVIKICLPALGKLLDVGASQAELSEIRRMALKTEGVKEVHAVRTRYIGSFDLAVDMHVEVDPTISVSQGHDISERVKERLLAIGPSIIDVVVHIEPYGEQHT